MEVNSILELAWERISDREDIQKSNNSTWIAERKYWRKMYRASRGLNYCNWKMIARWEIQTEERKDAGEGVRKGMIWKEKWRNRFISIYRPYEFLYIKFQRNLQIFWNWLMNLLIASKSLTYKNQLHVHTPVKKLENWINWINLIWKAHDLYT